MPATKQKAVLDALTFVKNVKHNTHAHNALMDFI